MPDWKDEVTRRLASLNLAPAREAAIVEEVAQHLEDRYQELVGGGVSEDEARRAALEELRDDGLLARRLRLIDREVIAEFMVPGKGTGESLIANMWQDIRYGLRQLRRSPGFTVVAVLTLALGIGANTAMFSVVEGVVLAPLPYSDPDRLVMVWENNLHFKQVVWPSYPNFQDWQRSARSFQRMAALKWRHYDLASPGPPEHLVGQEISSSFLDTVDVKLALGRNFSTQEDERGGAPVVIISNGLWRNRFASNPQALGKQVSLSGVDYTVVGILPPSFRFGDERVDVYTPLAQGDPLMLDPRGAPAILSIARLNPGVTMVQAQTEMKAIQEHLAELYPGANTGLGTSVVPLRQVLIGDIGGMLLVLLGAVSLVLLIACANVANLLLARSVGRTREFAIRAALGATRPRLVRQLLTESTLLSLAGSALGLTIAKWGVRPVLAAVPGSLPRIENIGVNTPVLLFTLAVSIAVGILFGLTPALKISKTELQSALKEGGRGATAAHHRAQNYLVVVEMALTLMLLVGAGLLVRTILRMSGTNPGFDTEHVITFKVGVSPSLTKTASGTRTAYRQMIDRIRMLQGVQAADFTLVVPLNGEDNVAPFWIGSPKPAVVQTAPRMMVFNTGPDYLSAMGIPLLRGRFFDQEDDTKSPCVAAIDNVFANSYFHGQDPLGQTITFGWTPPWGPCRIVGVVGHVRHWGLGDEGSYTQAQAYFPLYQIPDQWVTAPLGFRTATILVRTYLSVPTLIPAIKSVVYELGGDQPIYNVRTMQEIASESMSSQRFPMILLGAFASLALLLASIGIYGVISYSVAQRVHEFGIRMALGAEKRDVFRMVVSQGLRLALVGLAIGAAAALVLTRLLSSYSHLLYGVTASDPVTFVAVSLTLTSVAILACYIPARRAMRVDPIVALRHE